MSDDGYELVRQSHLRALQSIRGPVEADQPEPEPAPPAGSVGAAIPGYDCVRALHEATLAGGKALHEVPDIPDDQPLALEWKRFKRQLHRLLEEGHRGRFAVIKEGHPITVWDTQRDALQAGSLLHETEPFLMQEVQLFVRPLRWGTTGRCRRA